MSSKKRNDLLGGLTTMPATVAANDDLRMRLAGLTSAGAVHAPTVSSFARACLHDLAWRDQEPADEAFPELRRREKQARMVSVETRSKYRILSNSIAGIFAARRPNGRNAT
jgi:hypothetical protein